MRIARRVGLMQVAEAVHGVGRAIGKSRVVLEGPALLSQSRDRVGNRDCVFQFLERTVDQRPMCPGTAVRDIKMVAAGFCLEPGRAVGGDSVAEHAVNTAKFAGTANLLGQFFIAPDAVDQNSHPRSLPRSWTQRLDILYRSIHYVNRTTPVTHG